MELILSFLYDEQGAVMVEYAVMVTLITAVCITTVARTGLKIYDAFNILETRLQ